LACGLQAVSGFVRNPHHATPDVDQNLELPTNGEGFSDLRQGTVKARMDTLSFEQLGRGLTFSHRFS
jgi:hypothetical protein